MSAKKTIRIVKKGKSIRPTAELQINSGEVPTRALVRTITNWVTEFQQKRRTETANALRILSERHRMANET
jgi:hypothetical protein